MKKYAFIFSIVMLGLVVQASADSSLHMKTKKSGYWRYELVDLTLSNSMTAKSVLVPETLQASVWRGKKQVVTIGGMKTIPLKLQKDGLWKGYWPIPFNPRLGKYQAKIKHYYKGTTLSATASFEVKGRKPYALQPGFSVVTYEGGKKGSGKTPSMDKAEKPSWRHMVTWADYMGADAFWQCIGQTQVWGKVKEDQFPWSKYTVRLMDRVGKAAQDAGMKYGAWITAFVAIGNKVGDSGYRFTLGYDRKRNALKQLRYISLGDQKRLDHIVGLLKKFEASPVVDFIGLDYMRTDFGGYEFAEEFVRDFNKDVPKEWDQWSENEKSLWLARLIEIKRDKLTRRQWQWWRAHKVGLTIEYLLGQVKPTKPVWVFSLGWQTGHQHGQDMLMMLDAGIGFNAPMFYSISREDYPSMLRSWRNYLNRSSASVVIGQCVDWNLLGRIKKPASTAEHTIRQQEAIEALMKPAKHFGLFWHDLNRAFFGARGPFGTMEWVMSGAGSFSKVKAANGRYPFELGIKKPVEIILGRETVLEMTLTNTSSNTLNAYNVGFVDMPRLEAKGNSMVAVQPLAPGSKQEIALTFKVNQIYEKNGGQQMVAVKVWSTGDSEADPYFDYMYLPITKTLGPPEPAENEFVDDNLVKKESVDKGKNN